MNPQIVKLFGVVLVLYALLFGFTSYWSIFDAEGLENNVANKRPLLEEQRIDRGDILASDGSVIAESNPVGEGGAAPSCASTRRASSSATRSATASCSEAASASSSPTTTSSSATRPSSSRSSTSSAGNPQEGSDVQSSLDPEAQATATRGARRPERARSSRSSPTPARCGRWSACRPTTPTTSPSASLSSTQNEDAPLFNRATQAGYQPGSTMKVVTATAALDSGEFDSDTVLSADSPKVISGVPLAERRRTRASATSTWTDGADQLGQHLLGPGGRGPRHRHDVQVHGPLRLQRAAAARLSRRSSSRPPASSPTAGCSRPAPTRSTSAAWRSARTSST